MRHADCGEWTSASQSARAEEDWATAFDTAAAAVRFRRPYDPAGYAGALLELANTYLDAGQPDQGEPLLREGLQVATDCGDHRRVHLMLHRLAQLAHDTHCTDEAIELVARALEEVAGLPTEVYERPRTAELAARIHRATKNPAEARRLLDEVDLAGLAATAPLLAARVAVQRGYACAELGDHDAARRDLRQAIELHRWLGREHDAEDLAIFLAGLHPSEPA